MMEPLKTVIREILFKMIIITGNEMEMRIIGIEMEIINIPIPQESLMGYLTQGMVISVGKKTTI